MKSKLFIRSALSLVAILLMGALLLSSCSTEDTAGNTPTSSSSDEAQSTATAPPESTIAATAESDVTEDDAPEIDVAENSVTDNSTDTSYDLETTYSGSLTSFTNRSDDFSIGYYVSDGQVESSNSLLSASDEAVSSLDIDLTSNGTGFTPVYANGENTTLSVTGDVTSVDSGDGTYASDFTGLGSQVVATNYAEVNVDGMDIYTDGFMRDAFVVDNHAQITVNDSTITTMGANPLTEAYSGFENNADLSSMIATPWVLGIQGGIRLANVLGENATLSVIGSDLSSGGWAVLSTDSGSNSVVNVVDSSLAILPELEGGMSSGDFSYSSEYGSGYGSYLIGNSTQYFYGADISGTTYAAILTGGTATYQSSNGSITLENADGETIGTYEGENQISTINSVFGFMSHNSGTINVIDGTEINAEEAVFLYKAGDVTFNADNASLNSNSGIIFQMIDNDDAVVGVKSMGAGPIFNTTFSEEAGWPSENGNVTASGGQGSTVNLNLTNGTYTGNVYNGTGYYDQNGDTLNVTLGEGATLNGDISLTETRHVDENGDQNTAFTIEEYYYLGHVANRAYFNQNSQIAVTLSDGAVWAVTDVSYITSLTIDDGAIQTADGTEVVMSVDGVETPIENGKTYTGNIVISAGSLPEVINAGSVIEGEQVASVTDDAQAGGPPEGGPGEPPEGGPPEGMPGEPPEGGPPEGMPGEPPEGGPPEGGPGGEIAGNPESPDNGGTHTTAAVYIDSDARNGEQEYTDDSVTVADSGDISDSAASGVLLTSSSYDATGLVVTNNSTYTLGGDSETYSVYSDASNNYLGTGITADSGSDLIGTFDSVLIFDLDSEVDASATTGSSGIDVGSGSTLNINNTFVQVDGARRFAVSNYNDGTLIVNDSTFITTGDANELTSEISEPFSNENLLISGMARTNFSIGATDTYYFNSNVIAEGWAALSTDSATGDGLDLYAYNTIASALNGGYGTYADTNCRVWLYGSELTSAEIGAIIAKTGVIVVADGAAADSELLAYNTGETTTSDSTIIGGRNAVMLHAPDMMGEGISAASTGVLIVSDSTLATSETLESTFDYAAYSDAAKAYVDFVSGDVILIKSTSAHINLTNTELDSYNGVLIHTVLNNDSMGNFLQAGDNASVDPVSVRLNDTAVSGNILHDDYQRDMEITLDNTALTGTIEQGSYDSWIALWADKDVTEAAWLQGSSWSGTNTLAVTLQNGAAWTVTADSTLSSLTISDDSTLSAPDGMEVVMMVDGVETQIESGKSYTGTITISVN